MNFTLFHYWRSSSSWRVRWALEIKRLKPKFVHVNLLDGEVEREPHLSRNPWGYVPALEVDGRMLIESVPIMEFLEEMIPTPQLFPGDVWNRQLIRTLVEAINAGTQPIQNLNVLDEISQDPEKRKLWAQKFIRRGLGAYQKIAASSAGQFSVGSQITAADLCLIPQCYNAKRFEVDLNEFPLLARIYENAMKTPEAQASAPERFQP